MNLQRIVRVLLDFPPNKLRYISTRILELFLVIAHESLGSLHLSNVQFRRFIRRLRFLIVELLGRLSLALHLFRHLLILVVVIGSPVASGGVLMVVLEVYRERGSFSKW